MSIDAVITWVDGGDPAHRQKLDDYLASLGGARPRAARATRFHDAGEIEYCVASILRFAPWIQRIHIVSDAQTPALMARIAGTPFADRIRIVDHRVVFAGFEQYLPTFNSRAIIGMLWRIPGLAERFVYFNDDFMLLRPVADSDFFRDDRIVLRGAWHRQSHRRWTHKLAGAWASLRKSARSNDRRSDNAGHRDAQEASARLAGFERDYYRLPHNPYPFKRSTVQAFFERHPHLLDGNARHRLRSSAQFKAESLATHLEIANGSAVFGNALRTVQLKPRSQSASRMRRLMARADRDTATAFGCVQSLDLAADAPRAEILAWLDRRIGTLDAVLDANA